MFNWSSDSVTVVISVDVGRILVNSLEIINALFTCLSLSLPYISGVSVPQSSASLHQSTPVIKGTFTVPVSLCVGSASLFCDRNTNHLKYSKNITMCKLFLDFCII